MLDWKVTEFTLECTANAAISLQAGAAMALGLVVFNM